MAERIVRASVRTLHEEFALAELKCPDSGADAVDQLREGHHVAIARGLLGWTELLLLDEPTEGLAPQIVEDVMGALRTLKEESVPSVLVEQNVQLALDLADRTYIIESGEIVHHAPADELADDEWTIDRYLAAGIES